MHYFCWQSLYSLVLYNSQFGTKVLADSSVALLLIIWLHLQVDCIVLPFWCNAFSSLSSPKWWGYTTRTMLYSSARKTWVASISKVWPSKNGALWESSAKFPLTLEVSLQCLSLAMVWPNSSGEILTSGLSAGETWRQCLQGDQFKEALSVGSLEMSLVPFWVEPWRHRHLKGAQRDHRKPWGSSYLQTKETWGQVLRPRLRLSSTQKPLLSSGGSPQRLQCAFLVCPWVCNSLL